jgi:hypothetical protein
VILICRKRAIEFLKFIFMLHVEQLRKISLDDYIGIVGEEEVNSVKALAEKLEGKSVTHVNSTMAAQSRVLNNQILLTSV